MVVLISSNASRLKPASQRSSSPGGPAGERGRYLALHLGQIAGERVPREGGHHERLSLAMLFAIEDRKSAPAEQRLNVRQHPAFALNLGLVDELTGGVGTDDYCGRPAEELGLEDGTEPLASPFDEREAVLQKIDRLAQEGEPGATGGNLVARSWQVPVLEGALARAVAGGLLPWPRRSQR